MKNLDPYLIVVNKQKHYDEEMKEGLSIIDIKDEDGDSFIDKRTLEALKKLNNLLLEKYDISLSLTSAGRTMKTQQKVKEEMVKLKGPKALETTANPGESEHHTGLALDVIPHTKVTDAIIKLTKLLPSKLRRQIVNPIKDDLYSKMHQELEQCGFILRYTKDKQEITGYPAERWHIRYVGETNAKEMNKRNMCLEEYVEFIKSNDNNKADDKNSAVENENA